MLLAWVRVTFLPLTQASIFIVKSLKCFTRYSLGTPTAFPRRSPFRTMPPEACKLHKENVQIGYLERILIFSFKMPPCEFLNVLYMFLHDGVPECHSFNFWAVAGPGPVSGASHQMLCFVYSGDWWPSEGSKTPSWTFFTKTDDNDHLSELTGNAINFPFFVQKMCSPLKE